MKDNTKTEGEGIKEHLMPPPQEDQNGEEESDYESEENDIMESKSLEGQEIKKTTRLNMVPIK